MSGKMVFMAKIKTRRNESGSFGRWIGIIALSAFGVLFLVALFGLAGPVGEKARELSFSLLGIGSLILPVGAFLGASFLSSRRDSFSYSKTLGIGLVFLALYALIGLMSENLGGAAGVYLGDLVSASFGFWGALVLLGALGAIGLIAFFDFGTVLTLLGKLIRSGVMWVASLFTRGESGPFQEETGEPLEETARDKAGTPAEH